MGFIDIPAEQTTAFTDLILSALAVLTAVYIARKGGRQESFRKLIWFWAFMFLSIAAVVGAIAHGDGVCRTQAAHKVSLLSCFLAGRQPVELDPELVSGGCALASRVGGEQVDGQSFAERRHPLGYTGQQLTVEGNRAV